MPFFVETWDKDGGAELRQELRSEHIAYLDSIVDKLLAVGPKMDGNKQATGSFYVFDTEDAAEAEELIANDPYVKNGLAAKINTEYWFKAYFNKEKLI